MDKLDRMLRDLPAEEARPDLASSISLSVRRRHHRRQALRRAGAAVMGMLGLWLLWPVLAWLSSSELYTPNASWLTAGIQYLSEESLASAAQLWNSASAAQGTINSGTAVSVLLGAVLVCAAVFLAVDLASWQAPPRRAASASGGMLAPGLHL